MASPAIDAFITFRFLKLLVTPFDKTEAFKYGIIDKSGKVLRKYKTLERIDERKAYTILHRLVFNVKRLIEKEFYKYLKDNELLEQEDGEIREEITFADKLLKGTYILVQDVGVDEDDKVVGKKGDKVTVYSDTVPTDSVMGQDVYKVIHDRTKDELLITIEDIEEA